MRTDLSHGSFRMRERRGLFPGRTGKRNMIHTYYSNAFEVLWEILRTNLEWDARERRGKGGLAPLFVEDCILIPSRAVATRLTQLLAESEGICAGVKFITTNEFFESLKWYPAAANRLSGRVLDWVVWRWLSNDEFVGRFPRLARFLKGKNGSERYKLALRVSQLLTKYASYRLDWLLRWTDESVVSPAVFPEASLSIAMREEEAALERHPDFPWQKALWQEIVREAQRANESDSGEGGWRRALQFQHIERVLAASPEGENLHVFLPFTVPPLMLPFLKEIGKRGTVRLYLMQPANGFWFDAAAEAGTPALEYLRRNAASSRATLDRLWRFTADVPPPAEALPDARGEVANVPAEKPFSFLRNRLQDLRADEEGETDSFYLRFAGDEAPTLLTRAQDSLLCADEGDLFERSMPDPSDRSVRFVEAPTPVREAESLVDYLTELFAEDPTLTPSDVLVTTPDVATFAPVLEGVLTALPPERRLPFRMVGKPLSMENSAAPALLQLLDLLSGLTTLSAFESWLELPVVGESLGLTFGDLSILREWVNDAGFREGLSEAQLAAQSEKLSASFGGAYGEAERRGALDGTLSRALERLSAGFLFDESPAVDWAGTLPVRRSRAHYERVSDRPDLLETLLTLYKRLEDARVAWNAVNEGAPGARAWAAFTETVVNDFFAGADVKAAREELLGVVAHLRIDMEEGIGSETPVDYQTFRAALGASFGDPVTGAMPRDAVTVADMSAFRGLPYRVVACLGLSETSSFPGLSNFEEFDLMGLTAAGPKGEIRSLRRPGDRDSRADNRNVFADLFRSARSNFYVSWSIGTDPAQAALPSVVVEELERFLLTLLPESTPSGTLRVRLPLTSVAEENFRPEGLRFWTNRDPELFAAVEAARLTDRRGDPAPFADDAVLAPPEDGVVRWQEFLRFWTSPGKWLSGRTGVWKKDFETSEETGVTPAKSRLEEVMRKRLLRGLFEEGADVARATRLLAENPVYGDPGVRGWWFAEEIAEADELTRRWKEITEGRTPSKLSLAVNLAGRHVRRLTGEVRVYPEADGTSAQLVLADSNRAEKEALLTHVFLSAAGAETALGVLKKEDKRVVFVRYRPMEADEAEAILRQCVRLLDESFDRPVIWPDSFEGGVFWRGLDIKKARDLRKRVEDEIKALLAPLAEVTAASSDEASESSGEAKASDQPKKGKSTKKKTSKKKEPECTPEEKREKALTSLAESVEALVARNY